MKKFVLFVVLVFSFAFAAFAQTTVDINAVSADGVGKKIGTVVLKDTAKGLELRVNLKGIPEGAHGFHVHANPSCAAIGADGTKGAALAAGGHYDPDKTGKHLGPNGNGHKGDLPVLMADKSGDINMTVVAPRLKVKDVIGRSLMIHAGGDNYSDNPPLGGGGARIACGVVK